MNNNYKYCPRCKIKVLSNSSECSKCGHLFNSHVRYYKTSYKEDTTGYFILALFIPLIGIILGIIWKDDYPERSKACFRGILVGVILHILLLVITIFIITS